jgi:hypothetical protein
MEIIPQIEMPIDVTVDNNGKITSFDNDCTVPMHNPWARIVRFKSNSDVVARKAC